MRIFTIVPMLCLAVFARAADSFDLEIADIALLQDKAVQTEVKVTPAQRNKMNAFAEEFNKKNNEKINEYQKAKKQVDGAFQSFMMKQQQEIRTEVLNTLTADQIKRLRELTLQALGPRALVFKPVAKKVGMSDAELQKLRAAITEGDQKIAKIKKQVSDKIRPKYANVKQPKTQKEAQELQANLNKDINAEMKKHDAEMKAIIATSEKKTAAIVKKTYLDKLKALMGKPFVRPGATPPKTAPKTNGTTGKKPAGKKG